MNSVESKPDFTVLNTYAGFPSWCPACFREFPMFREGDKFVGCCVCGWSTPLESFYGWESVDEVGG
jgi:hypothetical protein